jgi:hypothetical protein
MLRIDKLLYPKVNSYVPEHKVEELVRGNGSI